MVSYYRPIVTLCLKCTVVEIWRHIARKSPKKPNPPSFGTFVWGDPFRIFRWIIPRQKLESWGYQKVYISRSCFRSTRRNTGVWQTDGRTDRQTAVRTRRCRKDRAIALRRAGKNGQGKVSIGNLAIQLTTPLLLRKPCKLFASVARVCQRQLGFLVVRCISDISK